MRRWWKIRVFAFSRSSIGADDHIGPYSGGLGNGRMWSSAPTNKTGVSGALLCGSGCRRWRMLTSSACRRQLPGTRYMLSMGIGAPKALSCVLCRECMTAPGLSPGVYKKTIIHANFTTLYYINQGEPAGNPLAFYTNFSRDF